MRSQFYHKYYLWLQVLLSFLELLVQFFPFFHVLYDLQLQARHNYFGTEFRWLEPIRHHRRNNHKCHHWPEMRELTRVWTHDWHNKIDHWDKQLSLAHHFRPKKTILQLACIYLLAYLVISLLKSLHSRLLWIQISEVYALKSIFKAGTYFHTMITYVAGTKGTYD